MQMIFFLPCIYKVFCLSVCLSSIVKDNIYKQNKLFLWITRAKSQTFSPKRLNLAGTMNKAIKDLELNTQIFGLSSEKKKD